jgi:hypothetical protein
MFTQPISRRHLLQGAAVAVPVGAVSVLVPTAAYADDDGAGAQAVVSKYFDVLNAAMASADADFSALSTVYRRDAVLTQSSPAGATQVFSGLAAVTGFYVAAWQNLRGIEWTQDHVRTLSRTVVLSYEHAGRPTWTKPGLCAHAFAVRHGRISSLDWVTYYPGIPS